VRALVVLHRGHVREVIAVGERERRELLPHQLLTEHEARQALAAEGKRLVDVRQVVARHLDAFAAAEPVRLDDVVALAQHLEVLPRALHRLEGAELGHARHAVPPQKLERPRL
jgi:hypothetical protein